MKICIAFISPEEGIGGGNRKYAIYFRHLNDELFDKHFIKVTNKSGRDKTKNELNEKEILQFIKKKKIQFVYLGGRLTDKTYELLKNNAYILINVNFTPLYVPDERVLNLIISKTDRLKIKLINGKLINDYVVYNPIDYELWTGLSGKKGDDYRKLLEKEKPKIVIGRLARAEPSKWEFLMIKTLLRLQKEKNYDYGFIFAGMPLLYRKALVVFLDKKMKKRVLFLPEMKGHEDLGKFYRSIDLFWQTSHIGESFGNVIAEAFCFGVPVITDYKGFLGKNGKVNKKKYDAQIEVVDDGKNGAYCNNPRSIIGFLKKSNKTSLKNLGENGKRKVKEMYDAKIAGETLAKILYGFLREKENIPKDDKFERLKQIPSPEEVEDYYSEYTSRLNRAVKEDMRTRKNYILYRTEKALWTLVEIIYLLLRKLLKIIGIDMEK